jgi:glycosyltransferase involved in cell wall biosynthesis
MNKINNITLSVIVPCLNEEKNLIEFKGRISKVINDLSITYKIYFIDDGSTDKSWEIIKDFSSEDKNILGIKLSKNFGHQNAISAGFQSANSDYVLIMDADLQDPPELLHDMYNKISKNNLNVVYAKRIKSNENLFKKFTSKIFYIIFNALSDVKIPRDTSDFRIIDKKILNEIKKLSEKDIFYRGLIPWMGFKSDFVEFERKNRKQGQSGWSLVKMFNFAITALTSFSSIPIRLSFYLCFFMSIIFICNSVYALYSYLQNNTVKGWTSIVLIISFFNIIVFFILGIISEYVGKIYTEIKNRPNFIIDEKTY